MKTASRLQGLLLLAVFLGGGLAMPLLDALVFHSSGATESAATVDELTRPHTHGVAHALGCSLWTSAASGGLPAVGGPAPVMEARVELVTFAPPPLSPTQTKLVLADSRAPPRA